MALLATTACRPVLTRLDNPGKVTPAIDGLSIAFDVSPDHPVDAGTLAAIRESGITAINMTTPYPGDDFEAAVYKISRLQQIVSEHPADLALVRTVKNGHNETFPGFRGTS